MEILTPKAKRRSTRMRVEIPISVTSLDRARAFAEKCVVLVVSSQGCGFRSSRALSIGTPILLGDLPGGGSVTGRVASCLPLGNEGTHFLIGVALYTHGNVWGIANPPEDWNVTLQPAADAAAASATSSPSVRSASKQSWPYNLFSSGSETPLAKK
jgi:hypothetical protein